MQVIKWKDINGDWQNFSVSDVLCYPVSHAVALFQRNIPVIVKEGQDYIVNNQELFDTYRKKGSRVTMIQDIDPARMDKTLSSCGFVCPLIQWL